MKILMYAPIFPPTIGGPSTQAYSLCGALHAKGIPVAVVTIGDKFERKSPDGYPVYRYPWTYTKTPLDKIIRWIVFPYYFFRILQKEKPDIVHAHSASILSFVAARIAHARHIPTLLKFAGDWVWETLSTSGVKAKDFNDLREKSARARLMWKLEKFGLKGFDYIWAPSEFRANNVEMVQGHRRNVRVIYNALSIPKGGYHEIAEGDPFIFIAANRFIPHKRLPQLVRAFAKLKNPNARLVLIGTGQNTEIQRVKDTAHSLGVSDRVMLAGRLEIEEVYKLFSTGSVYVSNSLEEGFPNVFVEAMRFGLPIISTDVGGCREIVQEGVTGNLFDPENQEMLVEKMNLLMHDYALRNRMARAAYEESHQYEMGTAFPQFLDLYKRVLESARPLT